MATDLSFKQVCEFIKKDSTDLLDAANMLLGIALVCSPIVFGPAALPALALLTAKNELTKLGRTILERITSKREDDFLAHQERMRMACGIVCFMAFFQALDRKLPESVWKSVDCRRARRST